MGERDWFRRLKECLQSGTCAVIESVDTLPAPMLHRVAECIRSAPARVILTSVPEDWTGQAHAALLAGCDEKVQLPPLRQRRAEIPLLIKNILAELEAAPQLRFTPAALEALARQDWPGNLSELRSVVKSISRTTPGGRHHRWRPALDPPEPSQAVSEPDRAGRA